MAFKYEHHGEAFKQEKERADKFESWYQQIDKPFQALKDEAHRLKLEVIRYE